MATSSNVHERSEFQDTTFLKIGFGFSKDLLSLKDTYPSFECFHMAREHHFLDLQSTFGRVRDKERDPDEKSGGCGMFDG
jgi:hypothetical protein